MPVSDVEKSYNEGSDVKLICVARGGKPPPRLTWYLENNVIDDSYEYKPDLGQTLNHLSYPRIGRHHYNSQFVCQSNNIPPDSHFNVDPPVAILSLIVNRKYQHYIHNTFFYSNSHRDIFNWFSYELFFVDDWNDIHGLMNFIWQKVIAMQ